MIQPWYHDNMVVLLSYYYHGTTVPNNIQRERERERGNVVPDDIYLKQSSKIQSFASKSDRLKDE